MEGREIREAEEKKGRKTRRREKKGRRKKKMHHWELNPGPFAWLVKALSIELSPQDMLR